MQPSNQEQQGQEALLASAFPQLPDSFRREVARQTCSDSQAVSAFGHICQVGVPKFKGDVTVLPL